MPEEYTYENFVHLAAVRRDWERHYESIGCHAIKAQTLAQGKVERRKPCPFPMKEGPRRKTGTL